VPGVSWLFKQSSSTDEGTDDYRPTRPGVEFQTSNNPLFGTFVVSWGGYFSVFLLMVLLLVVVRNKGEGQF
jgi:hypothetical protein